MPGYTHTQHATAHQPRLLGNRLRQYVSAGLKRLNAAYEIVNVQFHLAHVRSPVRLSQSIVT